MGIPGVEKYAYLFNSIDDAVKVWRIMPSDCCTAMNQKLHKASCTAVPFQDRQSPHTTTMINISKTWENHLVWVHFALGMPQMVMKFTLIITCMLIAMLTSACRIPKTTMCLSCSCITSWRLAGSEGGREIGEGKREQSTGCGKWTSRCGTCDHNGRSLERQRKCGAYIYRCQKLNSCVSP